MTVGTYVGTICALQNGLEIASRDIQDRLENRSARRCRYLEPEPEKVEYFCRELGISREVLPAKRYAGADPRFGVTSTCGSLHHAFGFSDEDTSEKLTVFPLIQSPSQGLGRARS